MFFRYLSSLTAILGVSVGGALNVAAESTPAATPTSTHSRAEHEAKKLSRITVTGGALAAGEVPGAADVLAGEEFETAKGAVDDVNRVLRRIPGINLREEDGYGLRPNIGLRGAASERSSNITLMEDGVLVAPAPYSSPAAYYFPPIGRMEGIEVLKGASQIKYGPRTTGGSLNMLSTSIPREFGGRLTAKAGEDDTIFGHLTLGESRGNVGWLIETYQAASDGFKRLDGGGDTGFDLNDYLGKLRLNTDTTAEYYQELELKLGTYDQDANETYLGLAPEDFDAAPYRRYRASARDNIGIEYDQLTLRHFGEFGPGLDLTTTFYTNKTSRNWYKLDTVGGVGITAILDDTTTYADEFAWIRGDTDSPADALALRNNRRAYASRGVQSVLGYDVDTGIIEHAFEFGARYHYDYEDRYQEDDRYRMTNGTLVLSTPGIPGSQSNRIAKADALALYLQDKATIGDWTFTPGLRYEKIHLQFSDFGTADPNRTEAALRRVYSDVEVWIPGIGTHYHLTDSTGLFAGIHRGFAPPGPSASADVDPEKSVNYELGVKHTTGALDSELTVFFNDYSNLLGADTASAGGQGTGDLFNAGAATVYGLETLVRYDLADALDVPFTLPVFANYTVTQAEFDDDFASSLYGIVESGDPIPYIPEHQAAAGIGIGYERMSVNLALHFVDAMPTAPSAEGRRGGPRTDSFTVFDLEGEYALRDSTTIFGVIENLFDNEYVVARRPAGARPGRPQTFMAGVKVKF